MFVEEQFFYTDDPPPPVNSTTQIEYPVDTSTQMQLTLREGGGFSYHCESAVGYLFNFDFDTSTEQRLILTIANLNNSDQVSFRGLSAKWPQCYYYPSLGGYDAIVSNIDFDGNDEIGQESFAVHIWDQKINGLFGNIDRIWDDFYGMPSSISAVNFFVSPICKVHYSSDDIGFLCNGARYQYCNAMGENHCPYPSDIGTELNFLSFLSILFDCIPLSILLLLHGLISHPEYLNILLSFN